MIFFLKFTDSIYRSIRVLSSFILSMIGLIIFAQVLLRYGIIDSFFWAEEAVRYLFIWLCFLGGTLAFRDKEHLGIDFFEKRMPLSIQSLFFIVVSSIKLIIFSVLMYYGYLLAMRGVFLKAVSMPWLNWMHIYSVIPFCGFVFILFTLEDIFKRFNFLRNK